MADWKCSLNLNPGHKEILSVIMIPLCTIGWKLKKQDPHCKPQSKILGVIEHQSKTGCQVFETSINPGNQQTVKKKLRRTHFPQSDRQSLQSTQSCHIFGFHPQDEKRPSLASSMVSLLACCVNSMPLLLPWLLTQLRRNAMQIK